MAFLLLLLFAVMFLPVFLGFRRQKRELARQSELQGSLEIGDTVVTFSGLHGTIDDLDDETVYLEIAPDVVTRWTRMAIREKVAETAFEYDDGDDDYEGDETVDEVVVTPAVDEVVVTPADDAAKPSLTKAPDGETRPGN